MKFKLALIYEEGIRHACITMKWLEDKKIGKKRATITLLRILRTFISRWRDIYKNDFITISVILIDLIYFFSIQKTILKI